MDSLCPDTAGLELPVQLTPSCRTASGVYGSLRSDEGLGQSADLSHPLYSAPPKAAPNPHVETEHLTAPSWLWSAFNPGVHLHLLRVCPSQAILGPHLPSSALSRSLTHWVSSVLCGKQIPTPPILFISINTSLAQVPPRVSCITTEASGQLPNQPVGC